VAKGGYRFFRLYFSNSIKEKQKVIKKTQGRKTKDNPWANKEGLFVLSFALALSLSLATPSFVFVTISCFWGRRASEREHKWSLRSVSLNFKCNEQESDRESVFTEI